LSNSVLTNLPTMTSPSGHDRTWAVAETHCAPLHWQPQLSSSALDWPAYSVPATPFQDQMNVTLYGKTLAFFQDHSTFIMRLQLIMHTSYQSQMLIALCLCLHVITCLLPP
jgi:hypothetical protein